MGARKMENQKLDLSKIEFSVNTDTVDIANRQIGISYYGTVNRVFSAGVNHDRTKDGVAEATRIARMFAAAPAMLSELETIVKEIDDQGDYGDAELRSRILRVLGKAKG